MKKIIIDLEGSDNGAQELFEGAIKASEQFPELEFVLSTTEADSFAGRIFSEKDRIVPSNFSVLKASDIIRNDEPAMSIFKGRDESSMAVALDYLKTDEDSVGLLCAGNTGALMVGSIFRLGLQSGLKQPALSTMLPNTGGSMTTLVDCGANVNIEASDLKNFARLGSDFVKRMFGIENPTVALLNVGREEGKGNPLYVEAYSLLKELGEAGEINFIGNAEGYDIISGYADVIVCDGFAGNVVLKLTEAVGKCALGIVSNTHAKYSTQSAHAAISSPDQSTPLFETADASLNTAFTETEDKLKELFVFNERGGATFLGTKKPVIKMHGCATAETVVSCVDQMLRITK